MDFDIGALHSVPEESPVKDHPRQETVESSNVPDDSAISKHQILDNCKQLHTQYDLQSTMDRLKMNTPAKAVRCYQIS